MTPLPNDLGQGGGGFHGEVAVRVKALLIQAEALVANFNDLLIKLDDDGALNDSNYAATLTVS